MKQVQPSADKQARWNDYGLERLKEINETPDKFVIHQCPIYHLEACDQILQLLEPLSGKSVLEVGCGRGDFSVWMAKQGANVTAVDIGAHLLESASKLAQQNKVEPNFCQNDIAFLPFASRSFDVVIGTAILHHLSKTGVRHSVYESHRVLKDGGMAIFHEPVENSRVFDFIQNLIPVGTKGSRQYRPSILQRVAWQRYLEKVDERPLSVRELVSAGEKLFAQINVSPYGLLIRFQRLIGAKYRLLLTALDSYLLRVFPPLRKFSRTVLIQYQK